MDDQQHQNKAADGRPALTAVLGDLADQFECHTLSQSIEDVESAGRAMRAAKAEIERLRCALRDVADHHENQRAAWNDECGDSDNARYHEERRNFVMIHLVVPND